MQEWEAGWVEPHPPIIYKNTCYICGREYCDTELSEICSVECLDFEARAEICSYRGCRTLYQINLEAPSIYCSKDCCWEDSQLRKREMVKA